MPMSSPVWVAWKVAMDLYFQAGERLPEKFYDGEHAVRIVGEARRGGMIDDGRVDDLVEGAGITFLYKRSIKTPDDGFIDFFG
jgi:hypothetical protein